MIPSRWSGSYEWARRPVPFDPNTQSFRQMRRDVRQRVRAHGEAQLEADLAEIEALYPHAVDTESGWSYVVIRPGTGFGNEPG